MMRLARVALSAAVLYSAMAAAAPAHAPTLLALDGLEKGLWEVRMRGPSAPVFNVCLGDPRQLLQLRHAGRPCRRYVIDDKANEVTVHYVCPGAGYGRTGIRIETDSLVQIHSQGIAESAPFSFSGEGRLKGPCKPDSR